MICSSIHPISDKNLRYLSSSCHLSRMLLKTTTFELAGFPQHILCFVVHALPHGWSMSGCVGRILLDDVAGDWQDVVSCLVQQSIPFWKLRLPLVQHIMPASQYGAQSGHWIPEDVSQRSKYSVLPMLVINSFDVSLNGLNSSVLFKSSIKSPGSGDSRTVESVFWRFPCDSSLLSGRLSEVYLEFCNQRYRDRFPCTYLADILRDACDVGPREVSDWFPCTSRFARFDGRWIFSLRG